LARCLIIACGCRGRALARELMADGHAVRGTSRSASGAGEIEAIGAEGCIGDPDRVATIAPTFEHVSVACLLLGSAAGSQEQLAALHGSRLEMMLTRVIDTTIHGVVYESAGTVDAGLLRAGGERVAAACVDARIPHELLAADPREHAGWLQAARAAVGRVLGGSY
jgi:uncharacterized protein YbjT (DUF2867 family)